MNRIKRIYRMLYNDYGPQGWWPLIGLGSVKYREGQKNYGGYHPADYSYPKSKRQVYEICIGAVLTQNTSWNQASKALLNLKNLNALTPRVLMKIKTEKLKNAIKPAGYFNQKAKKVREFTKFYIGLEGRTPKREELLDVWGIGPETADSMLLYAFKVPTFVVDAYTRRIFTRLGLIDEKSKYDEIKALFEQNLKPDLKAYQEYHALIVEHAKRFCRKRPLCMECVLKDLCKHG